MITAVFSATAITISVAAIAGVTAPVTGATPVSTTTAGTGYTGTVSWSGSPSTFAPGTIYRATITLTPTLGYTLSGVSANFFTVAGASSVTHSANSGIITAEFPATAKATQTITFTDPADITYGGSPPSLSATSTSTLTVAFTTATSGVCTVSGTTVVVHTAGTCTINANQAGDAYYEAASQVSQSFTIAKRTPSLSNFANLFKSVGGAAFNLTAPTVANSISGSFSYTSATTATATISGDTVTLGSAGTTLITATFTPITTVNFNNATIQMTLSVGAPYNLGDTGPGGGRIFYKAETPFACGPSRAQTCTYLEAAPAGWNGNPSDPGVVWAQTTPNDYRYVSVGTTGTAIGWGYANTKAIIDQGNSNITKSAAALADSYSVTVAGIVYDDWYLPSINELGAARDASYVRDGLNQDLYWSSSEFDANKAWYIWVINNAYSQDLKGLSFRVRPVRSF